MNPVKNVLLMIGSPKCEKGLSAAFGNLLTSKLEEFNMNVEKICIQRITRKEERQKELISAVNWADLIIFSFPLYVDSLPAPLIKTMEIINENLGEFKDTERKRFIAICNNGFPEASQNKTALRICENFAKECNFEWKGGISIGGGPMIYMMAIDKKGKKYVDLNRGFDMVAKSLDEGRDITPEVLSMIANCSISPPLYRFMGNMTWRLQMFQNRKLRSQ